MDVDENDEVTQEAGVRAMPTFLVYKGGKKTTTKLEGANRDALARLVESLAQSISSKQTVSRTPTPFVSVSTVAKSSEFSPTSTQPARKPTGWCCILWSFCFLIVQTLRLLFLFQNCTQNTACKSCCGRLPLRLSPVRCVANCFDQRFDSKFEHIYA